ncbi:MAG: hypothetical protein JW928_05645 [Candidatus Aureabacteria bacterium]|nr:hypothetical protein [Candidatus Auribacterota bacterium]
MKQSEAYLNRQNFEAYIPQRILELTKGGKVLDADVVNAYPNDLEKADARELLSGNLTSRERERAVDLLLDGKMVFQFLFAGAATRAAGILKGGAKYSFSIDSFRDNVDKVVSLNKEKLKSGAGKEEKKNLEEEISSLERSRKDFEKRSLIPLCLGAREVCQLRLMLERFSSEKGRAIQDVLNNIFFFVHINEQSKDFILQDFLKHRFFGFHRDHIIFIIQDAFCGYVFKGDDLKRVEGRSRPFGHGYTLMQTVTPGSGFILRGADDVCFIKESPLQYVSDASKGKALLMNNVNIDDLTKLTDLVADTERISFSMQCLLEGDADVLVEGVWNTKGQKGGSWLKDTVSGKKILVEGMCLKTSRFQKLFIGEGGGRKDISLMPLLNKMSNTYKIEPLLKYLPEAGLSNYLDRRDGVFFLESVTGDVTQITNIRSEAFVKIDSQTQRPEEIQTFKSVRDVYLTLESMQKQDSNTDFSSLAERVLENRS